LAIARGFASDVRSWPIQTWAADHFHLLLLMGGWTALGPVVS